MAAGIIFWKVPGDRRIKDQEECRKVNVIEEEIEESQTDSHHVQTVYTLKSQNDS